MRSDVETMAAVRDALARREPTSDGQAHSRRLVGFDDLLLVETDGGHEATVHDDAPADVGERPRPDALDYERTLRRRWSSLDYGRRPVRTGEVVAMLQEALRADRVTWGLDDDASPLEAFVFAFRSDGLEPGAYRVVADECRFVAPLGELGPIEDLGVQREFSTGAGIVSMHVDLDRADSWAGAHGYRVAALRASMATYDFHVRCQSRGLVGTIFGGFIPASVRGVVRDDGVSRHPMMAVTYAHAPDDAAEPTTA